MAGEHTMETILSRLEEPNLDIRAKAGTAQELRDNVDTWIQSGLYAPFLAKFVPVLLRLLDSKPVFISNLPEQRLRNCVLEIFHRFPVNQLDAVKPYALAIVDKLLALFEKENEENAILIVKILLALHRSPAIPIDRIQAILDLIAKTFEGMESVVKDVFSADSQHPTTTTTTVTAANSSTAAKPQNSQSPRPGSPAVPPPDVAPEQQPAQELLESTKSFKVMAECPITVLSILQQQQTKDNKEFCAKNVAKFAPLLKSILMLQAAPQERAHQEAAAAGTICIGVSKYVKNRAQYGEMIKAQVKTMSFLAHFLKSNGPIIQDFIYTVPEVITRLLKDLPKEDCATRKELLVSTRHIVNFNFRKIFMNSLDELLDPRVLLGDGLAVYETLRTLAYSFLADLIHHLRDQLTDEHIRKAIKVYTRNLADTYPGTSFQTMSAKLLMNIADKIAKMDNKQEARSHLITILDAIAEKFASLNRVYPNALKVANKLDPRASEISIKDFVANKDEPPDWDEIDIFNTSPIKITNTHERGIDPVYDNKFMFKNLVMGLKNLFYQLRACNPETEVNANNAPHIWTEVASGFTAEEVQVLIKLFHEGIRVFQYYPAEKFPEDSQASALELIGSHHVVHQKEEKELLESFATVFHHVDPAVFHEIFSSEIPFMYEMMFDHPALLQVPQFLLASEATSPAFASMLLQFLMERIDEVGSSNLNKATILLRLFKLSFMAVTLFSQHNESVLLPHVHKLITQSLELATNAEAPMHYFYLLRSLFRSIGGGRFEHLYKEILPLLEMLLDTLNKLIISARKPADRDLFVELSLTVPARLSHLLPHLNYLMKPLPLALRAGSDLVGQGLRTLELCVDNLTAEYLDPIMAPVIDDLMAALWEHLKPTPYSHFHAHTAMRILGKLGGRNRRFIDGPPTLTYKSYVDSDNQFEVSLVGVPGISTLPAAFAWETAIARLQEVPKSPQSKSNDTFYKQQAFDLIVTELKLMVGSDNLPDNFAQLVRLQADDLYNEVYDKGIDEKDTSERDKSFMKKEVDEDVLKQLLHAVIFATSIPELKTDAQNFLNDIYRHFIILEVGRALSEAKREHKFWFLDHRVLLDAILESLSSDKTEIRETAESAVSSLLDAATKVFGSREKALKLPIFNKFLLACCHSCHSEEWFTKFGGATGIHFLATHVGAPLIAEKQAEICRALVYAAKDLPDDVPRNVRTKALDTLNVVIKTSNSGAKLEDVADSSSRLHNVCMFLILELSSTSKPVREAAQASLALIAELTSVSVLEIVNPLKANLFNHIFTKPLRSVGIQIQIGYIESIAYCVSLGAEIVTEASEQLNRFFLETIKIVEAIKVTQQEEEAANAALHKPMDYRHQAEYARLQVSCLKLLTLMFDIPESNIPEVSRPKLISVFFKALYSNAPEVINAAYDALKFVVVKETKLPKDVLQHGLRPILVRLQDAPRLKEEHLTCLARLLKLLKNYFKVEIGHRLLDNVSVVADEDTLQKASFTHVEQHERVKVLAALFNIYHLLPDGARDMLPRFVSSAISIEQALRRTHFSPLRQPVCKYLNRYAEDAWNELFSQKLDDHSHSRFFSQILALEDAVRLREVVAGHVDTLVKSLTPEDSDSNRWVKIIDTILIISSLCKFESSAKILFAHKTFIKTLFDAGKRLEQNLKANSIEVSLRLAARQASELLLQVISRQISSSAEDIDTLFHLAEGVALGNLDDIPRIWQPCLYNNVISSTSVNYWHSVAHRCIEIFISKDSQEPYKTFVIRNLLNPILAMDAMRNWDSLMKGEKSTAFLNKHMKEVLRDKIWKTQTEMDPSDENTPVGAEFFRMELLQMATTLLKYFADSLSDTRREVIRFLWNYIRLGDFVLRFAAYVVVAYFISVYESPPKITMTVYSALVRVDRSEARSLVTQALEVLAPVIPERMAKFEPNNPYAWIKATRKPILEDPSLVAQTQSILLFVARHPDLFYEAKEAFTQMIASAMPRIAPVPSTSLDNKKAHISLISLMWSWQKRYISEQTPKTGDTLKLENTTSSPQQGSLNQAKPYLPSKSTRTVILKYFAQFIITLSDRFPLTAAKLTIETPSSKGVQPAQTNDICQRSLDLFQCFISVPNWSDVELEILLPKMNMPLQSDPKPDKYDPATTAIINTLQLFRIIVNVKTDEWILNLLPRFKTMLEKLVRNPHPEIQEALHTAPSKSENEAADTKPILLRILETIPPESGEEEMEDADAPATDFINFLCAVANETTSMTGSNNIAGINVLLALSKGRPQVVEDQHVANVMKIMNQAVKDHTAPNNIQTQLLATAQNLRGDTAQQQQQLQQQAQSMAAIEMNNELILNVIDFLAMRISLLGDNRRPFLQNLSILVEKSPNKNICSKILDLMHTWIFNPGQTFPTIKEKVAIIIKMITFEHRPDQSLFERFLDLIIQIYEDSKITRSELAIRLESAFLIGTRTQKIALRDRFLKLFDKHLSRSANKRLLYLLAAQDWHELRDSFWLSQIIHLLLDSVEQDNIIKLLPKDIKLLNASNMFSTYSKDDRISNVMLEDDFETLMLAHRKFCAQSTDVRARNIMEPLSYLQHTDPFMAAKLWTVLFPKYWAILAKDERTELQTGMVSLLTKEYHTKQMDKRPNCIQALTEGIARTSHPRMNFPHHLMKYLAKTYNSWYNGLCYMEENAFNPIVDTPASRESNLDALAELYASLEEADMFYGLWRKRCEFLDTNTALSYEQHGNWDKAQRMFESATLKARTGAAPFKQAEYMLWEDHWVRCAQKLQQWDVLSDFAKNDNLNDLFLDAVWRNIDFWHASKENQKQLDNIIKGVSDAPTPRRAFFQAFMSLLKLHNEQETAQVFSRTCDEAIQLSIRKWHQLPKQFTNAHIPILQNFQQLVELYDASVICTSLSQTTTANLDHKSPELKLLLSTWRDRLPNFWDDINAWQELVTWRQHIFSLINRKYLSLVPSQQTNVSGHSHAYRGYHETASIINRFAHVARKHDLPEVCITQLSKIYTLPNIEIQEAFLKLREQAKCHFHNENELQVGLDVINNTNLNYFGQQQKAEFYTLKGMFLAKQNQMTEADEAFGSALYFDLKLPKAWAEWARYNDRLFKENPSDISKAANAMSCYLEAAATYKNAKSRKFLSRILWLLSLDDAEFTLAKTFVEFKGEMSTWYWITFIPQLLTSLSRQEGRICRTILAKIARNYPQAVYFSLRTSREDMSVIKKNTEAREAKARAEKAKAQQGTPTNKQGSPPSRPNTSDSKTENSSSRPGTANGDTSGVGTDGSPANVANSSSPAAKPDAKPDNDQKEVKTEQGAEQGSPKSQEQQQKNNGEQQESKDASEDKKQPNGQQAQDQQQTANGQAQSQPSAAKKPWEYQDEIGSGLKVAFPLLALSLETMVDQITRTLKASTDEDAFRLISALLNDAINYVSRSPNSYSIDVAIPSATESNITRFAETVLPNHLRSAFAQDFLNEKVNVMEYIQKLRKWRDRFEEIFDRREQTKNLESYGPHLSEFKFLKFDEVEIPGQYLLHKDSNRDFVRIERFMPNVDMVKGSTMYCRRLWIRGHDGSAHPFVIQHPSPRHSRRDERMLQMVRFFNDMLDKQKESRRRNIKYLLPAIIPLTPAMRMIQDDPSYLTLQGVYDDYCRREKINRDDPILFMISKMREAVPKNAEQVNQIKMQAFEVIQEKFAPNNLTLDYFQRSHSNFSDFWLFRKQFAYQLAGISFLTYIMFIRERVPSRINISRRTGNIWTTDLQSSTMANRPTFGNTESVPFRLTPTLQMLIGPIALEGVFASTMLVIAKALAEPLNGTKLEQTISIFIRDEMIWVFTQQPRRDADAVALRNCVNANSDLVVRRAQSCARPPNSPNSPLPANQTVLDLVAIATQPRHLAHMDPSWSPWL